ncbi:hypothetical protein [Amycolatopsis ultiminotia]|uniref:hypothetical protein n=1 Tax=Amycolatopsis ultiminotia TaxID=543629 RepID=UPI0031EB6BB3
MASPATSRATGHGVRGLSARQAQLIALTRAYAAEAGIVVPDQATSTLDPTAEVHAEHGGTLVVIAHRLSSGHAACSCSTDRKPCWVTTTTSSRPHRVTWK